MENEEKSYAAYEMLKARHVVRTEISKEMINSAIDVVKLVEYEMIKKISKHLVQAVEKRYTIQDITDTNSEFSQYSGVFEVEMYIFTREQLVNLLKIDIYKEYEYLRDIISERFKELLSKNIVKLGTE
jgi:hypothetical protein